MLHLSKAFRINIQGVISNQSNYFSSSLNKSIFTCSFVAICFHFALHLVLHMLFMVHC